MLLRLNEWKSLRSRYEEDRPHRMLALDGGGIRGLITLGILSQIEELIHLNSPSGAPDISTPPAVRTVRCRLHESTATISRESSDRSWPAGKNPFAFVHQCT
jgi:hypothetical protein